MKSKPHLRKRGEERDVPKPGFVTITVPKEIAEEAEKFLSEHRIELAKRRIRNKSQLFQAAVIEYMEKFEEELKRSKEKISEKEEA